MSSSDDEDLQRAIALSLGQLDGAAEDERASAADNNTSEAPPAPTPAAAANQPQLVSTRAVNESLKHLDRKQLEAERLARQRARKHQLSGGDSAPSSQESGRVSKKARTEASAASSQETEVVDLTTPPRSRKDTARPKKGRADREPSVPKSPTAQSQGQAIRDILQNDAGVSVPRETANRPGPASSRRITEPQYLDGAVKRTWSLGYPRDNDIKIEEVLQKADLDHLLVSSFNFDTEWWSTKIDSKVTKQTWIVGSSNEEVAAEWNMAPVLYENVSISLADMKGVNGNYHAKLWDWGESGRMENTVFLIDLPRLPDGQTTSEDDFTPFGKELRYYIQSVTHRPNLCNSLLKFDWSRTKHLAFVHSLGGPRTGEDAQRTGLPGLSRAIRQLNLDSTVLEVDYATSSLGALSRGFMKQLLTAAKGEEVTVTKEKFDGDVKIRDLLKGFRVYFPTFDTVKESKGGTDAGGTITFSKKWYEAMSFPKSSMHDHKSTRTGLLSHNKIIIGRGQRVTSSEEEDEEATTHTKVAWAYIGSANLSAAAWGQLSTDRATKTLKVTCRNYECGVIVPVDAGEQAEDGDEVPGLEVFKGTLDIPFEIPGEKYGDKSPWYFAN
ncbi:Phospholipase d nuclease [Lasiodiplodia theobromae]|uniref:Phospholipase d nuclease n=1 Tax=Lasiodiplodia theobromae TaxID=45133 RepID=UPI0015C3E1DD|nr:Phospholipase d nuclease [Lasiodiplodia theobromae]KAF4546315.1 Phospholipase d nuclease [Lasiodiplodia theobromae]